MGNEDFSKYVSRRRRSPCTWFCIAIANYLKPHHHGRDPNYSSLLSARVIAAGVVGENLLRFWASLLIFPVGT